MSHDNAIIEDFANWVLDFLEFRGVYYIARSDSANSSKVIDYFTARINVFIYKHVSIVVYYRYPS